MAGRYERSWSDPAIQGVDLALRELDDILSVDEGLKADIRECTEDARRDAIARWDRTAGMAKANTLDRSGARRAGSRTQRYREAIRSIFFDDGMTGKVFIAFPIEGPRGQRAVNLPLWLEYGTKYMNARQHLIPAFELAKAKLNRLVERRLNSLRRWG